MVNSSAFRNGTLTMYQALLCRNASVSNPPQNRMFVGRIFSRGSIAAFPGVAKRNISRNEGPVVVKLYFTKSQLREKHFLL